MTMICFMATWIRTSQYDQEFLGSVMTSFSTLNHGMNFSMKLSLCPMFGKKPHKTGDVGSVTSGVRGSVTTRGF